MIRLITETIVEAPIEAVFNAFLDVERYPEWSENYLNATDFEVLEKPPEIVGMHWRKKVQIQKGVEGWSEERLVELERPSRLVTESKLIFYHQGKRVEMLDRVIRSLEALEGGRTRLRAELVKPKGGFLLRILMWFQRKKVQKVAETSAKSLSEYLRRQDENLE